MQRVEREMAMDSLEFVPAQRWVVVRICSRKCSDDGDSGTRHTDSRTPQGPGDGFWLTHRDGPNPRWHDGMPIKGRWGGGYLGNEDDCGMKWLLPRRLAIMLFEDAGEQIWATPSPTKLVCQLQPEPSHQRHLPKVRGPGFICLLVSPDPASHPHFQGMEIPETGQSIAGSQQPFRRLWCASVGPHPASLSFPRHHPQPSKRTARPARHLTQCIAAA